MIREVERMVLAEARRLGLTEVTVTRGGKHEKMRAVCKTKPIVLVFSAKSTCWRAPRNAIAQLRRMVRAVQSTAHVRSQ